MFLVTLDFRSWIAREKVASQTPSLAVLPQSGGLGLRDQAFYLLFGGTRASLIQPRTKGRG